MSAVGTPRGTPPALIAGRAALGLSKRDPANKSVGMAQILVIDDEPEVRSVLESMLMAVGHDVISAPNGLEGMRAYGMNPTDLVITDLYMPEQEGIETIHSFRKQFPALPIIAISGNPAGPLMLSIAERLGAVATLQKPFSARQLFLTVEKTLRSSHASTQPTGALAPSAD